MIPTIVAARSCSFSPLSLVEAVGSEIQSQPGKVNGAQQRY
jgi:hypothetical protein